MPCLHLFLLCMQPLSWRGRSGAQPSRSFSSLGGSAVVAKSLLTSFCSPSSFSLLFCCTTNLRLILLPPISLWDFLSSLGCEHLPHQHCWNHVHPTLSPLNVHVNEMDFLSCGTDRQPSLSGLTRWPCAASRVCEQLGLQPLIFFTMCDISHIHQEDDRMWMIVLYLQQCLHNGSSLNPPSVHLLII